jgi:hypothetical protein
MGSSGYDEVFYPLGQFDELGCTYRGVSFDTTPFGPRIGGVMVPDITKQ